MDRFCNTLGRLIPICLVVTMCIQEGLGRCLEERTDQKSRYFYYRSQNLPITIEVSDRASHRLASNILKIILEEWVGYDSVHLVSGHNAINTSEVLDRIAGCSMFGCTRHDISARRIPRTMVNVEVWSRAGFNMEDWFNTDLIVDGGPLGPKGKFGWFVPTYTVQENWNKHRVVVDHWRALQLDRVTSQFTYIHDKGLLESFLSRHMPNNDADKLRMEGSYHGKCEGKDDCAVLLSSFQDLYKDVLPEQIDNLHMNVSIAWIGRHLDSYVHHRTIHGRPTLFFNWMPNTLTASGNFTRIYFPPCTSAEQRPKNCDFEVNQLSKVMWSGVKDHAPEAAYVIQEMHFTDKEYKELLRSLFDKYPDYIRSDEQYENTACDWIKNNRQKWMHWVPTFVDHKRKIYLGGMFPLTGPYWRQPGIVPGAHMAVTKVNLDSNVLNGYELEMIIRDTKCKADVVMKQFMYWQTNQTHPIAGILGPGCSETAEPIAGVSKHFNTIIVSYSAEALVLGNRAMFPYFFRTVPQMSQFGAVYVDIFKKFNWRQVALLAEDGQEFPEYHALLQETFLNHDISVPFHRKIPRQATVLDAQKYVDDIKNSKAKIIIFTSFEVSVRAVLCVAYQQKMTSREGYVWFLPSWFTLQWWDTDSLNVLNEEEVDCTTAQMKTVVERCFELANSFFGPAQSRIVGNMTVEDWSNYYINMLKQVGPGHEMYQSMYATYAYDAVWVFALGLDKLLKEDPSALDHIHSEATTKRFMFHLNKTNFEGVSGPVRFIGADRAGIITIKQYQMVPKEADPMKYHIGTYFPDKNASQSLELDEEDIRWGTRSVPNDGIDSPKVCSVEGLRRLLGVECDIAIVVANILGVGIFFLLMVISLLVVKKKYDDKVRATQERMEELGLMADTSWLSLDQWEVPRDHVVLNRKLGEGAFGTVYGGEALISDVWVAVAVKTLKIGSNPEEKLDFLSEAEMMKRFDHENVVKLLAVCTRGEPAYTIMEFMLHGDLKTFLLARRHLVGEITHEAEDISATRLTAMALDIAYGVKYLTDLKYVHRDLACRNCLVHASKSVKIGDFGMTRPTYDSDYYRFTKRGMLPVRWMAPESISDGIFTSASDIWSFGVLLFEIMTFGSFPYQGLSNRQVLDHIKNGNTIRLPDNCNLQLEKVLAQCWSFAPSSRPHIEDLILILKDSPELIVPCLDAPRSAVAIETTGDLELDLPATSNVRHRHKSQRNSIEHHRNTKCIESPGIHTSPTTNSIGTDPLQSFSISSKEESSFGARDSIVTIRENPVVTIRDNNVNYVKDRCSSNNATRNSVAGSVIRSPLNSTEDRTSLKGLTFLDSERSINNAYIIGDSSLQNGIDKCDLNSLQLRSLNCERNERTDSGYGSDHSKRKDLSVC